MENTTPLQDSQVIFKNPFGRTDFFCGLAVGLIAFFVYAWTAAPNVTLEDSGEFTVAAQHFGVPHPSGYAFWTMTAWLFSRLPMGNPAWEIAIYSGVCGAIAMGLLAFLLSSTLRHILKDLSETKGYLEEKSIEKIAFILTLSFGLCAAFNVSIWSQSVIVEVYAMHTLLTCFFLLALYLWLHNHNIIWLLVPVVFFYALGLSNHHLTLPYIAIVVVLVMLLKLGNFFEIFAYLQIAGASVYGFFAYLSDNPETPNIDDPVTQKTAIRFAIYAILFLLVVWRFQKKLPYWKQGLAMIAALFFGLSPYVYQPFASNTNPPMNWGYNRTKAGFFYSINRSQYSGSLSGHMVHTIGKAMGSAPLEDPQQMASSGGMNFKATQLFAAVYWKDAKRNFSFPMILLFMGAFVCMLFLEYERRVWILVLLIMFLVSAFLQALLYPLGVDKGAWDVQLPFHTVSFSLIPFIAAMTATGLTFYFIKKYSLSPYVALIWLFLPLIPLIRNYNECSQRGHWFGWHFGHDMLVDLPKDSVVYGGTDPGRFIPTYMIFAESFTETKFKRDPHFDRRDLYIITQNALADEYYENYIHDHYSDKRPQVKTRFEKWLGRDKVYPKEPLTLPAKEEIGAMIQAEIEKAYREGKPPPEVTDPFFANSLVAEWIFLKNKDKHRFFVEESAPMPWSYPYAIPHGLCYEINREPLPSLSPEIVKKDMAFWANYKKFLLSHPRYKYDVDAQRDFSKLRSTMGNIYRFRKMAKEAEIAYRDALELCPYNVDVIAALTRILVAQGNNAEAEQIVENALAVDPLNPSLQAVAQAIILTQTEKDLKAKLQANPQDAQTVLDLLNYYFKMRNAEEGDKYADYAMDHLPPDTRMFAYLINYYLEQKRYDKADYVCLRWVKIAPDNPEPHFLMSRFYLTRKNMEQFYKSAEKALSLGGMTYRQKYIEDAFFDAMRYDARFMGMIDNFHPIPTNSNPQKSKGKK